MTGLKNNVSPPSNQICRAQQASRPCHLEFFALAMVRMCRLAPTMATLILAPWEFWLSCKNWDRGGNTDLCHSQEGVCVCGAAGGRWVTRRLQGSDPLDLWPNSISPASLDHHYQTLSLRLSRIANLGGKNEQYTHFFYSLCFLLHSHVLQSEAHRFVAARQHFEKVQNDVWEETDVTVMSCCYGDGAEVTA